MATASKLAGGSPGTTQPLTHALAAVLETLPRTDAEALAARLVEATCAHIARAPLGKLDPRILLALDTREDATLCRCEFCGAPAEAPEGDLDEAMEAGDHELADAIADQLGRASDRATRMRYLGLRRVGMSPCDALHYARHPEHGGEHVATVAAEVVEGLRRKAVARA